MIKLVSLSHNHMLIVDGTFPLSKTLIFTQNTFTFEFLCTLIFSEEPGSKSSENTENRKEADEGCSPKPCQAAAQPPATKGSYGKAPPSNQVCCLEVVDHMDAVEELCFKSLVVDLLKGN